MHSTSIPPAITAPQSLAVNLSAGLSLQSLLLNASGAFNPSVLGELFPLAGCLGAFVTKTVTPLAQAGNPMPRTVELPGVGMLNSIGIQNAGLAHCLAVDVPAYAAHGMPVILSISAGSSKQFAQMAEAVMQHPNGSSIVAIELNLSCPNVEAGGSHFGSVPAWVGQAVAAIRAVIDRPVWAKLTPNVTDVVSVAAAAVEAGADGLTAINTVLGAAIDIRQRKPFLKRVSGGYSGPGIKPIAIHAVYQLYKHFPQVPIVGVGGICRMEDVLEFIMAGATAVQVGTGVFRHPLALPRLAEQLHEFAEQEGLSSLSELIGCAHAETRSALLQ
ncbi:MAG: dihydroorotate dehydrogenase [Candidatus Melainabacteria bacterium]|nr:dihydroorotate dehydrogenase [Candidatus Melainabacteria bacterium]